ncbi:metallophosphoesterase [Cohnella abietis]|uniref:Metallophosphoesterase n=1 Tax=Cohnella abietis TaxID=2507935 RepID=A0A3T1D4M8_9BACL|nr:metallophosphoesterase [Cohnella abietis]BBI32969.1 metallophosphoesterase [Cohnella abietis]
MLIYLIFGFVIISILICTYGVFIEPRRLTISRHTISSPLIPEGFHGITIVQFSDTHIGPHYSLQQLDELITAINSLQPDIVVFTGDLFDSRGKTNATDNDPTSILARIHAPLGKFAVYGNHDFGYTRKIRTSGSFLNQAGFKVIINDLLKVRLPAGEFITIAGLDDYVLGQPAARKTLSALKQEGFNLLLTHEPDVADSLAQYPVDLQLSGHSHGGQVHLPILGALIRTSLGRRYVRGMYSIQSKSRGLRPYLLFVNRGIGTTRIRIRIGSAPELSVFTLNRE